MLTNFDINTAYNIRALAKVRPCADCEFHARAPTTTGDPNSNRCIAYTQNVKSDGTSPVDVHHNLRLVKLSADVVDKSNVSLEGQRSQVFAALPVENQQKLFGTRAVYSDSHIQTPIISHFSTINFKLETNSDCKHIEMDALLDIDIMLRCDEVAV